MKKEDEIKKAIELTKVRPTSFEFINSTGRKITLHPIPPMMVNMATASIKSPEIPTYVVDTANGGKETHFHDEKSIEQSPPEEKIKWEVYLKEVREAREQSTEILLNVILLEGVEIDIGNEDELTSKMRILHILIPEDPIERKLSFKKMLAFANTDDMEAITKKVMELTGVSREEIDSVKESFPDTVESKSSAESGKESEPIKS
jgi:hypothetical protein